MCESMQWTSAPRLCRSSEEFFAAHMGDRVEPSSLPSRSTTHLVQLEVMEEEEEEVELVPKMSPGPLRVRGMGGPGAVLAFNLSTRVLEVPWEVDCSGRSSGPRRARGVLRGSPGTVSPRHGLVAIDFPFGDSPYSQLEALLF